MIYTLNEIRDLVTPIAKKYQLNAVYIFGSYARGEASTESDIDLLVDLSGSLVHGILLGQLYTDLQEALRIDIDLVTVASLSQPVRHQTDQEFREAINRDRRILYAAA